jgi:putative amide transporter protein
VNGIWLIGAAQVAAASSRVPAMDMETAAVGGTARSGYAGEAASGQEMSLAAQERKRAEASPLFIQNREVAILNIFTGGIGLAIAITYIVIGGTARLPVLGLTNIQIGGTILLFAFTYLWVAYNQYANAGGRALGWYSLFVAITAVYAGIYVVQNAPDNTANLWLAGNWFAWAILWGMFWALLSLELPIARITGWVALIEGVGTGWALALALLWGKIAF